MTPEEFEFVRTLLQRECGVVLGADKEYLVESRLGPLVHQDGMTDTGALIRALRAGTPGLRDRVVDALTTHETYFFRDVHPFNALRDEILPEMLARQPRVSIWSAAAATGQEPYSLAIMLLEHFGSPIASILATDVSGACLRTARAGTFTQLEVNRGLPAPLLIKYFERSGLTWTVASRVRSMVSFRELNLIRPWTGVPGMDIILMRNVLTYFDRPTREAVLQRAAANLRPGGVLFLGGSETTIGIDPGLSWTRIGKTVCYRKDGSANG